MNPVPDLGFSLIKISASLAVVIGIVLLLSRWMKGGRFGQGLVSNMNLKMLGALPLGVKKSIALVKVADRVLVVAVGTERIQLLDTIRDSQQIAKLENQAPSKTNCFGKHLKKFLKQGGPAPGIEEFRHPDDMQVQ